MAVGGAPTPFLSMMLFGALRVPLAPARTDRRRRGADEQGSSGAAAGGRRRRRTDGCASQASAPASPTALIPSSVACRPRASAIGPAIAIPSGMRPIETLKS